MDSEFSDTKKIYEVKELEEYETVDDSRFKHVKLDDVATKQPQLTVWKIPIVIAVLVLMLAMFLMIILQSITIAHLNILPVVCPEEAATTSPSTDALTGTTDNCRDTQNDIDEKITQLLSRTDQLINTTRDILSISDDHYTYSLNNTDWIWQILETTQGSAQKLYEIVQTLSNIKDSNVATEVVVNDILMIVEELLRLQNDSFIFSSHLPISCQDIKDRQPNSPSGYYHINSQIVYCEMGELCSTDGGWTRLAYLDMTDSTVDCPPGFKLYQNGGVRACGRPSGGASCASVKFLSNGISYSEVCGRVVGYQFHTPDALFTSTDLDINSYYVDGVSITRGYPRKHVWTLINGYSSSISHLSNCPCNTPPGYTVQSFIGDDYFCEAGLAVYNTLYVADPLWDGEGCGPLEQDCCSAPGLPWFHKTVNSTTDYLEVRVCADQNTVDEDVPISFYEIYVK